MVAAVGSCIKQSSLGAALLSACCKEPPQSCAQTPQSCFTIQGLVDPSKPPCAPAAQSQQGRIRPPRLYFLQVCKLGCSFANARWSHQAALCKATLETPALGKTSLGQARSAGCTTPAPWRSKAQGSCTKAVPAALARAASSLMQPLRREMPLGQPDRQPTLKTAS